MVKQIYSTEQADSLMSTMIPEFQEMKANLELIKYFLSCL